MLKYSGRRVGDPFDAGECHTLSRHIAWASSQETLRLESRLSFLATVGSAAPFVGLFGTVVGIIRAFQDMAEHGAGGFEVVASGISEALVATAAGLAVAIISLFFFNYLQTRVNAIAAVYARSCERFVQALVFVEAASEQEGTDGRLVPAH